jgi:hypothetical protein
MNVATNDFPYRYRRTMCLALFAKSSPMDYALAVRTKLLFVSSGIIFIFITVPVLRADQVEMQNGDRYLGKVLSVSADTVRLESEVLGKINVPRKNVANIAFGTNAATKAVIEGAVASVPTNLPTAGSSTAWTNANADLSAALRNPGGNTNFVRQIREQMLKGNPEAASKYDELVSGLLSGKLNLTDLRREAKSSADQLRALQHELGPDAGDSLGAYLDVLDNFLKESTAEPALATPVPQPKVQAR